MLVGVYTTPSKYRGHAAAGLVGFEQRYLQRVLGTTAKLKTNTRFLVFTHEANHDAYAAWDRVLLEPPSGGLAGLRGANPVLNQAITEAQVDLVFSPLESAPVNPPVPQVLYALDLAPRESGPGKRGPRRGPQVTAGMHI